MNWIWIPINLVQCAIIMVHTALCGILGIFMRLVGFAPSTIILFLSRIAWGPLVCAVSLVTVKLEGSENIPKDQPSIFVANHESMYDIVVLARVFPVALFYVAKKELRKVPFFGWYMIMVGHIFVDRGNPDRARQSMKEAARKIREGKNIISFPEGTRSKSGDLLLFRKGTFMMAKEAGVNIVPIGIIGTRSILPSGKWSIRPGKVTVKVGKYLNANELASLTPEQAATSTRERVALLLKK
jgi:1-acyl-sn-glycerol-3-phosphate acyltransferase